MKKRIATVVGMAAWVLLASGCAPGLGGGSYTREQAGREQNVRFGVVDSVREVQIEGTRSGIGAAAGAVVGGIAGSTVGQGRGSAAAAVLGGVAGGVAGQAAEQGATRQVGYEITIRLDSGQILAVTQGADEMFRAGDRVRVLSDGVITRVTH